MGTTRTSRSIRAALVGGAWGLALLAVACGAPERSRTTEDTAGRPAETSMAARADEGAVIAAHRSLVRAFEVGDAEAAAALFDPREGFLIFHPYVENRFDGYDEAREGLGRMFSRLDGVEWTEVHQALRIEGDVAWLTAQVLIKAPALETPFVGRGTEIWVRRHGAWRLSHGHWSEHASLAGQTGE